MLKHIGIKPIIVIWLNISILAFVVFFLMIRSQIISTVVAKNKLKMENVGNNVSYVAWKMDRFYTSRDVVNCLDTLLTKMNSQSLHIAFIGDSLVRNQFVNFIKVPVYICFAIYFILGKTRRQSFSHICLKLCCGYQESRLLYALVKSIIMKVYLDRGILFEFSILKCNVLSNLTITRKFFYTSFHLSGYH